MISDHGELCYLMSMRATLALLLVASPSLAETQVPRESDVVLDRSALRASVIGATHTFFDGGRSFFSISGTYSYTYASGEVAYGTWSWPADNADGVICTAFRHGFERCDMYVQAGARLVLITKNGTRFPIRDNSADE